MRLFSRFRRKLRRFARSNETSMFVVVFVILALGIVALLMWMLTSIRFRAHYHY
jgi:hypothetical protein